MCGQRLWCREGLSRVYAALGLEPGKWWMRCKVWAERGPDIGASEPMRGWHFSLASVGSHGGDFGRGTILLPCHLFDVWSWACQFTSLGLSFPICKIEIIAPTSGLCAKAAARAWHMLAVTVATHLAVS